MPHASLYLRCLGGYLFSPTRNVSHSWHFTAHCALAYAVPLFSKVSQSEQPTAQGVVRSADCRTPFRLCLWRHRSLRSRCLPTLRLHCGGKLSIVCADTLLYSLPRQIRVALSARQLLPTPFAHALRITAHRHSPHKWRDRCSRKVKIPLADFDFHGSDFTAHRLGVGAYNATENEVGAVVFHWAVGGIRAVHGALPRTP